MGVWRVPAAVHSQNRASAKLALGWFVITLLPAFPLEAVYACDWVGVWVGAGQAKNTCHLCSRETNLRVTWQTRTEMSQRRRSRLRHQEYFLAKNICLRVAALVPLLFAFCNQGSSESQILRIDFNLNAVKIAAK